MRILILFFFFFPFLSFADRFQFSSGMGYRRDEAGMRLSNDSREFYSSKDLLNGVELASLMKILFPKVQFSLAADVGWYVSGSGRSGLSLSAPAMPVSEGRFNQSCGGFFTDAWTNLGYAFGQMRYQFLPQAGYGLFYQQIKFKSSTPAIDGSLSCDLTHSRLKRFWFGPSLGADLFFRPHYTWIFSAGYAYYFLHFDQKFDLFSDLTYSSPVFTEYFIDQRYRASVPARGQKIYGKISAQVSREWRMNLRFDAFLFSAHQKSSLRQNYTQVFPGESAFSEIDQLRTHAWWQAYSALVEIEYFF